jgi:hypothetical protein
MMNQGSPKGYPFPAPQRYRHMSALLKKLPSMKNNGYHHDNLIRHIDQVHSLRT